MVAWLKQPHSKLSFRELFLETQTTKISEVLNIRSPKSYINSLIPTTITYSNWSNCLRYQLWTNTSSLHTPLNPALIQPTLPLISNSPFDKSNIMSHGCLPQPKARLYIIAIRHFMAFHNMFHPLSFNTTNIRHTKPHGLVYKHWI